MNESRIIEGKTIFCKADLKRLHIAVAFFYLIIRNVAAQENTEKSINC